MKNLINRIALASLLMLLLVFFRENLRQQHDHRFATGRGYEALNDTTFRYFHNHDDGCSDTTYYRCDNVNKAMLKIFYADNYNSLNWAAQKEYHEDLLKYKTVKFIPSKKEIDIYNNIWWKN